MPIFVISKQTQNEQPSNHLFAIIGNVDKKKSLVKLGNLDKKAIWLFICTRLCGVA